MKKSIRIIAVAIAAIVLCMSLVSCGLFGKKLDGKFENESNGVTYDFDGKNVTITAPDGILGAIGGKSVTYEGTYEIDDDKITFKLVDDDGDELEDCYYNGTFDFEEAKNGDIIIGKTEYEIVE